MIALGHQLTFGVENGAGKIPALLDVRGEGRTTKGDAHLLSHGSIEGLEDLKSNGVTGSDGSQFERSSAREMALFYHPRGRIMTAIWGSGSRRRSDGKSQKNMARFLSFYLVILGQFAGKFFSPETRVVPINISRGRSIPAPHAGTAGQSMISSQARQ